ncbi:MAG: hypothetical protein ACI8TQ_002235 [Planctomycetota bacterium]|jgi:hypothetical protein
MKRIISLFVLCAISAFIGSAPQASIVRAEAQRIPGTSVSLVAPLGFELSESFAGFFQASTGASLLVVEVEGGYTEIVATWEDVESLAAQGMKLLGSEDTPYESSPGLLCKVAQDTGTLQVTKWIWIFGTETHSVLIVGNCPNEFVDSTLLSIRGGVLSAKWNLSEDEPEQAERAFAIAYSGGLKATEFAQQLIFTVDGEMDKTGKLPLFVAGASLDAAKACTSDFAEQRLRETASHQGFELSSPAPIEIDGLSGWELYATAKGEIDGGAKSIYQVMLFEGRSYWLLQGIVAKEQGEQYLPEFKQMAQSFRRAHDTLVTESGLASIVIPKIWSHRSGIAEGVELQAGNLVAECYLLVGSAAKGELPGGFAEYTEQVFSNFKSLDGGELAESDVNGMRCISGFYIVKESGLDLAYFLAAVEGRSANHALIFWCMASEEKHVRAEFRRILSTFKEVE